MNPFSRVKNLYNIQKAYGYIRDLIEKPELRRDKKHISKTIKALLAVQEFREMIEWLKGKKTYIVAALTLAVQAAYLSGFIDESMRDQLLILLGSGAVATVAAKINRIDKKVTPVILFMLLFPAVAFAQLQFPITVNVVWDAYPATDGITKFTITHNGTPVDVMPSACTATECAKAITLQNAGPHVVSVTATNMWGTSAPNSITFTASSPGRSGNIRIRLN